MSAAHDERFERLLGEGAGVLVTSWFSVRDLATLMETAALARDAGRTADEAERVIGLAGSIVERIVSGQPDERPQCMNCDTAFTRDWMPAAVGVVEAATPSPSCGMVFGICPDCVASLEPRQRLARFCAWFERVHGCQLRQIAVHEAVGHA